MSSGLAYPPYLPDVSREAAIAAEACTETMQYGPLMGIESLREQVARFVAADGVACNAENVLITNGAKHALDLVCRVFTEPGDSAIVSTPTYMTALIIMRQHGLVFLGVPQDEEGLDADTLREELERMAANGERMPKLLFDVPDFHNPTGITMSKRRREALIALAEEFGFVICEDDPYRRLRFEGEPVPPIKALSGSEVVIAIGTVSKILSPGLRTGWAIAAPEIVNRMGMQKAEGGSSPFGQRVVAELMRSNRLSEHIDDLAQEMRKHRDAMVGALAESLSDARVRAPGGGYFLWLELPQHVSAEALAKRAVEYGVEASSGRLSFPGRDPGNFMRLAYSYPSIDQIQAGIRSLAAAYQAEIKQS